MMGGFGLEGLGRFWRGFGVLSRDPRRALGPRGTAAIAESFSQDSTWCKLFCKLGFKEAFDNAPHNP